MQSIMSCLQITVHQHCCNFTSVCHLRSASSVQCATPALQSVQPHKTSTTFNSNSSSYLGARLPKIAKKLSIGASGVQISTPVCLFGGKGKSENADEGSAWKALEKAMRNFGKEQSAEDVLRQQMQKQEYIDDGGSGGSGPGGGSGGSGGNGESEDESLSGILDELLQVIFAAIGFVFLYMLIIEGEEITTFAKDIIRFLFTGRKSIRLRRLIDDWVRYFRSLSATKDEDPYWLERAILATPTWYDSPTKYKRMFRRYTSSRSYSRSY
ncbi:uncharacterized protein LOC113767729 [Coffea eugenioides]|uniref:Uncharacterized protein isoform X1 n=1 Tax=Coffea arabica TaxID=13443 RepID=A0A6P6XJE9_COFAR|nr:uncharacterized protein LOC113739856 isoform X1 [Coffea arabica]XP_027126182.1 uncharacterized protein LOC113742539 isoform X1 [Coffea arabica]XP_027167709.1 uncharacterized protein LOC113767729 [Coffea eugenioides]